MKEVIKSICSHANDRNSQDHHRGDMAAGKEKYIRVEIQKNISGFIRVETGLKPVSTSSVSENSIVYGKTIGLLMF